MPESLQRGAERLAADADRLGATFAASLASVWRAVERRLRRLLVEDDTPLRRQRKAIRDALEAAGWHDLASLAAAGDLRQIQQRVLNVRAVQGLDVDLSQVALTRLGAMQTIALDDLLQEGEVVARELHRAVVRATIGKQDPARVLQEVARILDRSEARVRTLYDTTVSIYGRQVEAIAAGDDPETRFAYVGPVDAKIRPFCLRHIGQVYTRAEIDAMDNGQLHNVFLTGGGWNCRHTWMEISAFSELNALHGTGLRMPEVERDLRSVVQ